MKKSTKKQPIPAEQWKWFGNAAHFCCGRWCRFHMATLVGKYIVSTVGEYVHPSHSKGSEKAEAEYLQVNPLGDDIGIGRKFETMVFKAGELCECGCGLPSLASHELDSLAYNTRVDATKGHMKLCRKWAKAGAA